MKITQGKIKGLFVIEPKVFEDERGFFMESYNKKAFEEAGINIDFVQDNHTRSSKGILRGLHFQKPPKTQDKLVRVVRGEVMDVAVDIRKGSPTYGKYESIILSEKNKKVFLIPKGFAHAYLVLSDITDFEYKVSDFYSPQHDLGIIWNDSDIKIDWPIKNPVLSEKDRTQPALKELKEYFT